MKALLKQRLEIFLIKLMEIKKQKKLDITKPSVAGGAQGVRLADFLKLKKGELT